MAISLPPAPSPAGNYVPYKKIGNMLYLSGSLCLLDNKITHSGKVGRDISLNNAIEAARICALNQLAIIKLALGTLDCVNQIIILNGFVNGVDSFSDSPKVINGASDLYQRVFGDIGKHARTAVSVNGLPLNAAVEIQTTLSFDESKN